MHHLMTCYAPRKGLWLNISSYSHNNNPQGPQATGVKIKTPSFVPKPWNEASEGSKMFLNKAIQVGKIIRINLFHLIFFALSALH